MADFPFVQMTARGLELQAKAQTGQALKFLRVELGDGAAPADVSVLTGLVNSLQDLPIIGKTTPGNGTAELLVVLTNAGLMSGFFMRELGVIVEDPDTGEEVLYSYTNAGLYSDYMPAFGGASVVEQTFNLITVIGNAANVTAVINDSLTFTLKKDFLAIIPRLLPVGGTVGQMIRKASNSEGDFELFDPELDGLNVKFTSVEEPRVAVANQRIFSLKSTVTNGLAVYVEGKRLSRELWKPLSATQLQLTDPLAAGARVLFVNNEEAGPGASVDITLTGPALVYGGSTNTFTITNVDDFSVYTVVPSIGTAVRSGATITLTVPAGVASGTMDLELTRNNASITRKIAVGAAAIMAPEITFPVSGSTNVGFEPEIAITPFVVYPSGYDSSVKTQYQIATDESFTNLVVDVTSTTSKDGLSLASIQKRLDPAKRYYSRARRIGNTLTGAWSNVIYFNTAVMYIRRPEISAPLDGAEKVSLSFTFKCNAFAVSGGVDEHIASRWQLSLYSDFRSVVEDTGWSTTKLLKYLPTKGMVRSTNHFIRMAQKGKATGESEWSPVISFMSAAPLNGVSTLVGSGASARDEHTITNVAGSLYVVGGYSSAGGVDLGRTVFKFDPALGTWQQKAALAKAKARHGAVSVGGMLYVFGGSSNGGNALEGDLQRYDPATDKWVTLQAGPPARVFPFMVEVDGYIYVGGGILNNQTQASGPDLWRYNIQTNSWTQLASVPEGIGTGNGLAVAIGKKIYALRNSKTTAGLSPLDIYDTETNTWSSGVSPPNGVGLTASAVVSGLMYTCAGIDGGPGIPASYKHLQEYDPATGQWRLLPDFAVTRYLVAACELNGAMYVFGGLQNSPNIYTNTLYRVD